MLNRSQLEALRRAQRILIASNPKIVTGSRPATKDNGAGVLIPDPDTAATTIGETRVRIASENSSAPGSKETPVGLGTNLSEFLIMDYRAPFQEGDTITDGVTSWEVGHVNLKMHEGKIYGADAALTRRTA